MRNTLVIGVLLAGGLSSLAEAPLTPKQLEFFEKNIRPVLATQCYSCHSAAEGKDKGGLTLDTRDALRKGGDSGEVIIPGDPKNSLLIKAMKWDPTEGLEMPPKTKLDEATLADFEAWVAMGAPDPREGKAASIKKVFWTQEQVDNHWAYQPIAKPVPPTVKGDWARTPVDRFIRAKHETAGLQPAKPADKRTLIRRAYYDLIGLPPTMAEVEAFEKDTAPNAFNKVINQLLERPEYGERWGRYWLDIARYADTSGDRTGGNRRNPIYPYAWTYRDYVIRAFNEDKPFNDFIIEQIAADQVDINDQRDLAALGYLTVGKRFDNDVNEIIDDRIDVVGKGFMGLTLACARCHDHKFDPIPTADYYSLHGVFASSRDATSLIEEVQESDPQYVAYTTARQNAIDGSREYGLREYNKMLTRFTKESGKYLFETQRFIDGKTKAKQAPTAATAAGLNGTAFQSWVTALQNAKRRPNRVFGPWFFFAKLPNAQIAARTPAQWERLKTQKTVNPILAKALAEAQPKSLREIAGVYQEVFLNIEKRMDGQYPTAHIVTAFNMGFRFRTAADAAKIKGMPKPLAEPAAEEIRRVAFGYRSALGMDPRSFNRLGGNRVRNRQVAMFYRTTGLDLTHPGSPAKAMALEDIRVPRDSRIFIRGERTNLGDRVPRQFLELIEGEDREPFNEGSGRLELAQSIASKDNPLTARVMVNRVWQWHFGEGIVRTPSDFGLRSDTPSHPDLLDWLARRFMAEGWSIKQLHRLIMNSAVYQQSATNDPAYGKIDPNNALLYKWNLRRLDFESMRDTLLVLGNNLDPAQGGRPVRQVETPRRTVYGYVDRAALPDMYQVFDFANPDMSTAERVETIVPQQALFLMNSQSVLQQARRLAARSEVAQAEQVEDKVQALYELVFQRAPTPKELQSAAAFVKNQPPLPAYRRTQYQRQTQAARERAKAYTKRFNRPAPAAIFNNIPIPMSPVDKLAQVLLETNEFLYVQ